MSASRIPSRPSTLQHPSGGITILVTAAETGGAMSMVETLIAPGGGPTYHCHSREDETFYVVSGTAEIRLEDQLFICSAGDVVFGPRNVFHSFRNAGADDLKLIATYTPGGFEQSFIDATAMLQEGKDQSEVGRMLNERYGLTRVQRPM